MSENITIRDSIYGILKGMKPPESADEKVKVSFSDIIQSILDENKKLKEENIKLLGENKRLEEVDY